METVLTALKEINPLSITLRIGLSILIGGILGAERSLRNRPAGFMTYVLVCMGSAIIMLTNHYIYTVMPGTDPARLGAQVVSGIGFLCAGTIIIKHKDEVYGLTTAAGLWVTAGLGLALGAGFYSGALIGCLFYIFSMSILRSVEVYIRHHARNMEVYLEYGPDFSMRALAEMAEQRGYELYDIQRDRVYTLDQDLGSLTFSLDLMHQHNHMEVMEELYYIKGVEYIQEIL